MWLRGVVQGLAASVLLWNAWHLGHVPIFLPFAVLLAVEAWMLLRNVTKRPREVHRSGWAWAASVGVACFPVVVAWSVRGPIQEPWWRFELSYVIQLVALGLEVWALIALRTCFSQLAEAHDVVRHGPYRYVRHPLYIAYGLGMFGSCVGANRLVLWGFWLLFVGMEILRARAEEQVLARVFPTYRAYQAETGMWFPRWRGGEGRC
ncbi:isoprenylcysteine carboxylmethyltransferase family protein [Alicyclobacillus mali]|uniref:Isoprenylcysteine carboxylmethyltransferase family protein n=2 Tax=Alicyclobacillus mali (ex Roth et al. 2021) TaxID=1123961 RepID=A0ABS0F0L3_9BACL|nr:isoprenylcysteine carboxylmethyltransferase family protein [Alicyclobacillus mali (ex Roth et al. 2021)]